MAYTRLDISKITKNSKEIKKIVKNPEILKKYKKKSKEISGYYSEDRLVKIWIDFYREQAKK